MLHYSTELPKTVNIETCSEADGWDMNASSALILGLISTLQVVVYIQLFAWTEQFAKCVSEFLAPDGSS